MAKALTADFQRARSSHTDLHQCVENARLALRRLEEDLEEETKLLAEKREAGMRAYRVYRTMREQEEEAEMRKFLQFLNL